MSWLKSVTSNISVQQLKEWKGQITTAAREMVIEGTRDFYNAHLPTNPDGSPMEIDASQLQSGSAEDAAASLTEDAEVNSNADVNADVNVNSSSRKKKNAKPASYEAAHFVEESNKADESPSFLEHYEQDTFVESHQPFGHDHSYSGHDRSKTRYHESNNQFTHTQLGQLDGHVTSSDTATNNGDGETNGSAEESEWHAESEVALGQATDEEKLNSEQLTEVDLFGDESAARSSSYLLPASTSYAAANGPVLQSQSASALRLPTHARSTAVMSRSWHELQSTAETQSAGSQTDETSVAAIAPASNLGVEAEVQTQASVEDSRPETICTSVELQTDEVQFAAGAGDCHQAETQTNFIDLAHVGAQIGSEAEASVEANTQTDGDGDGDGDQVVDAVGESNHAATQTEEVLAESFTHFATQTEAVQFIAAAENCHQVATQTVTTSFATAETETETETETVTDAVSDEKPVVDVADVAVFTDPVRTKARKVQTDVEDSASGQQLQAEIEMLKVQLERTEAERLECSNALAAASNKPVVKKRDRATLTETATASLGCQTDADRTKRKDAAVLVDADYFKTPTRERGVQKDVERETSERWTNTEALKPKETRVAASQTEKAATSQLDRSAQTEEQKTPEKVDVGSLTEGQLVEAEAFFSVRNAFIQLQQHASETTMSLERMQLENERLKGHLVELDQSYTSSLSDVESRERALQRRATEYQQQCELLAAQLDSAVQQRDEAHRNLQSLQQRSQSGQQAIERLQSIIQVYEKEKEELVMAETERFNKDAKRLESELALARRETALLQEKMQKQQADLDASRRLSEQLYVKDKLISQLQNEVQNRDNKLAELTSQIDKLSRVSNQTIDRTLIKSLFLSYVNTPISKRIDVIRLMCNVLQCDESEQQKAIETERSAAGGGGGSGWMSGFFSGPRGSSSTGSAAAAGSDQSIAAFGKMFVDFLEQETEKKPQLKLPVDQILQRNRLPSGSHASVRSSTPIDLSLDRSASASFGFDVDSSSSRGNFTASSTLLQTFNDSTAPRAANAQTALDRYNDVVNEHLQSMRSSSSAQHSPAANNNKNISTI